MFSINNLIFKDILNIRNLEINRDNITCITGESGCGKSTLLKMLNRMLTPDSGNIKINDTQINDIDVLDLRRKVLMVSQNPVIFEGSIRDNLISGCRFAKKSIPSDNELKKILEIFRLNIGLEKSPENLSGGEKQRISLVRALLTDPEVLLLDEPSSALDEGTEEHVISSVVKHASDRKITLIIVTHSMLIAEKFCEINIRLEKGKIYDGCTLKEEAGV